MLWFMGSQRVGHDGLTELNSKTNLKNRIHLKISIKIISK